jgi:hypothetical protein
VIDVLDDLLPADLGKLALHHRLVIDPLAFQRRTRFVAAALLRQRGHCGHDVAGTLLAGDTEFFAQKRRVIIDHHDATVFCQRAQHVVVHVARVIGDDAARRV